MENANIIFILICLQCLFSVVLYVVRAQFDCVFNASKKYFNASQSTVDLILNVLSPKFNETFIENLMNVVLGSVRRATCQHFVG